MIPARADLAVRARLLVLAACATLAAAPALAEETICTPSSYLGWEEGTAVAVPQHPGGQPVITRIDLETGAYRDLMDEEPVRTGSYRIVRPGNLQTRDQFVAATPDGDVLRIVVADERMPFVRLSGDRIAVGNCVHEYDLP